MNIVLDKFMDDLQHLLVEKQLIIILYQYYHTFVLTQNDNNSKIRISDIINIGNICDIDVSEYFDDHVVIGDKLLNTNSNELSLFDLSNHYIISSFKSKNSIERLYYNDDILAINYGYHVELRNLNFDLIKTIKMKFHTNCAFVHSDRLIYYKKLEVYSLNIDNPNDCIDLSALNIRFMFPCKYGIITSDDDFICLRDNKFEETKIISTCNFQGSDIYAKHVHKNLLFCVQRCGLCIFNILTCQLLKNITFNNENIYEIFVVYDLLIIELYDINVIGQNYQKIYNINTFDIINSMFIGKYRALLAN